MIGACIMDRDGCDYFYRMLESIQWVDDIVVVNTDPAEDPPSGDVVLAWEYGARVFHHPWEYNFSTHRNQAFEHSREDWLFVIDSDETANWVKGDTLADLEAYLGKVPPECNTVMVPLRDFKGGQQSMESNTPRLFRRSAGQKYERRVHNDPKIAGLIALYDGLEIHHFGYARSKNIRLGKLKRTEALLLAQAEEEPEIIDSAFYLCQLYGQLNDTKSAIKWGERYIEQAHGEKLVNRTIYFSLAHLQRLQGNLGRALELVLMGLELEPNNCDLCSCLCDIAFENGDHRLMLEGAMKYVDGYEMLLENPELRTNKFLFTAHDDMMTLMLHRVTLLGLEFGLTALGRLKQRLPGPQGMLPELEENLTRFGLLDRLYPDGKRLHVVEG